MSREGLASCFLGTLLLFRVFVLLVWAGIWRINIRVKIFSLFLSEVNVNSLPERQLIIPSAFLLFNWYWASQSHGSNFVSWAKSPRYFQYLPYFQHFSNFSYFLYFKTLGTISHFSHNYLLKQIHCPISIFDRKHHVLKPKVHFIFRTERNWLQCSHIWTVVVTLTTV